MEKGHLYGYINLPISIHNLSYSMGYTLSIFGYKEMVSRLRSNRDREVTVASPNFFLFATSMDEKDNVSKFESDTLSVS